MTNGENSTSQFTLERVPVSIVDSSRQASCAVASEIASLIRERASKGKRTVLGLATGSTPSAVYDELIRLHRDEGLSFATVTTFNLDEYWPMEPDGLQSYNRFMRENLFDHIDIDPANTHIPDGSVPRNKVAETCAHFEDMIEKAGGIDIQLLGIGRTGHVGFNEPGSSKESRTRLITLDRVTRMDAASDFFGEWNVPRQAITMGVGTILDAKRVILMAFGEHKAPIISRAVEGEIDNSVAASHLQEHPNATFVLDSAASAELTRARTPWLLGPVSSMGLSWDAPGLVKKAVTSLAHKLDKPILKLTNEDYNEHGLSELVAHMDSAYDVNIEVFKLLQKTITGWPGGKKDRPRFMPGKGVDIHNGTDVFPKRIVIFSPHPDDDVISMGGTFIRLCEQGHEVHVAYQTSGNIAVFDDEALRHLDFVRELACGLGFNQDRATDLANSLRSAIENKEPGEVDTPELQLVKGLIRRTEARAAACFSGTTNDRIHFLDMPFYETGKVRKMPLSEDDIEIVTDLLNRVQPHQIYAAGDLSDPHGTHRVCLAAITTAVRRIADRPWMKDCEVWLYRGAWQEWGIEEIDMAVPLSPGEVDRKRAAIFKHESQKDKALFPGPNDPREFWKRAEDRNRFTAERYDKLGLPEYEAIEGFVMWRPSMTDGAI